MKILILLFFLTFSSVAISQKLDYAAGKDTISSLTCEAADSVSIIETIQRLLSLDTNQYDRNLHLYFRDLGWSHYKLYRFTHNLVDISTSLNFNKIALYHDPNYTPALWDISLLSLMFFKDCETANLYLKRYKEVTPRKFKKDNKDDIKYIEESCKS